MTITQIRYFIKICETGSITAAAEELFITRSALSKSLKDLESECGGKLLMHEGNLLVPTLAGEILREKGLEMIELSESAVREIKNTVAVTQKVVRFGTTPATGIMVYPLLCREFAKICPGVKVMPIEGGKNKVQNMLESRQMDVCITTVSETFPDQKGKILLGTNMVSEKLSDTELVFCAAKNHPLASKRSVTVEDIADEDLVFLKKPLQREAEICSRFSAAGLNPKVTIRASQVSFVKGIVSSGTACSIQIRGMIDNGTDVLGIPLDPPAVYANYLIWNRKSETLDHVKKFIDLCRSTRL